MIPPLPRAMLLDLDGTIINFGEPADPLWLAPCTDAALRLSTNAAALSAAIPPSQRRKEVPSLVYHVDGPCP